jgi:peptidyl-prolyl cis-trans isomerase B (cyclophilin B)
MKKMILFFCLFSLQSSAQKKIEIAQIKTAYGEILVWLYNETSRHKASFIQLAKAGYWDSLTFNRVIPNFVIQGGCPDTEQGFTDPNYLLAPEFDTTLKHTYGTFAAGRDDNKAMNSARCQFYIVQNKQGLPSLDNKYTVYGKVIKGMDVVDAIANVPKDKTDTPLTPIKLDVNIIKMKKVALIKMGVVL